MDPNSRYIVQKKIKEFNARTFLGNFFRFALFVFIVGAPTLSFAQGKKYAIRKIVIDPGHGGHDSGCKGKFSMEKEVALAISLKFGKLIEDNFPEIKVIYTRKTDVFVTLNDRADIANDNKADFFICIHCNSGSKEAHGTETFVMGLHKTADNLVVAQRENASILMEENYQVKYEGFNPNSPEAYISFALYQNAFLTQSLTMASKVENYFKSNGRVTRGVKQAGFWVLYRTTMPSILVETGFLTNIEEEKYLNSEKGQNEVAMSIFKAFKDYKEETEGVKTGSIVIEEKKEVKEKVEEKNGNTEIYFAVQIATASEKRPSDLGKGDFKKVDKINTERGKDGTLKYTVGVLDDYNEAAKMQEEMKEKGFKSAFIIAYKNKERISVSEARQAKNKN